MGIKRDVGVKDCRAVYLFTAAPGSVPPVKNLAAQTCSGKRAVARTLGDLLACRITGTAVRVEGDGDRLGPMGIERNGGYIGKLGLVCDLASALRGVEPAAKEIARARRVGKRLENGSLCIRVVNIIIVLAHNTAALGRFSLGIVVQIYGDRDGQPRPDGVKRAGRAVRALQIFNSCPGGIAYRARICPPTEELIACASEGVFGQPYVCVIYCRKVLHRTRAAIGVKFDRIADGRPFCRVCDAGGNHGILGQLRIAAEPAAENIAGASRLGNVGAAQSGVFGNADGALGTVIIKGHRVGVCPDRVEIESRFGRYARAVGIDHRAVGSGRPAGKNAVGFCKGVGVQFSRAEKVLRGVAALTAVCMERDDLGRARRKIAEPDAVAALVTAAVLIVSNLQHFSCIDIQLIGPPVDRAAELSFFACCQIRSIILNLQIVVFLLR